MGDESLPQHGNQTTYNLENVLYNNLKESLYYKNFLGEGTIAHFGELIDVIYDEARRRQHELHALDGIADIYFICKELKAPFSRVCQLLELREGKSQHFQPFQLEVFTPGSLQVHNVEPWMSGNARGPSTAFCCLWKMFKMKPSPREIRSAIDHRDSPYIRAVRFGVVLHL